MGRCHAQAQEQQCQAVEKTGHGRLSQKAVSVTRNPIVAHEFGREEVKLSRKFEAEPAVMRQNTRISSSISFAGRERRVLVWGQSLDIFGRLYFGDRFPPLPARSGYTVHPHCEGQVMVIARGICPILVISSLAMSGCDSDPREKHAAPTGTSVAIISTTPGYSETLYVGDTVNLQVEVEYQLSVDSGTLSLVVQESDNSTIRVETEVLTRGRGTTTFDVEFEVPDTKTVQIFTPITAQGQTATSTVDTRAFKVEASDSEDLNLAEATEIDGELCTIGNVAVGASYEGVISTLGQPQSESGLDDDPVEEDSANRSLDYDLIYVGIVADSVIIISSEDPEKTLGGGIGVSSTRTDVAQTLGDTIGLSEDGREVLAYRCRGLTTPFGGVMVAVVLENDLVKSVSLAAGDE